MGGINLLSGLTAGLFGTKQKKESAPPPPAVAPAPAAPAEADPAEQRRRLNASALLDQDEPGKTKARTLLGIG